MLEIDLQIGGWVWEELSQDNSPMSEEEEAMDHLGGDIHQGVPFRGASISNALSVLPLMPDSEILSL